MDEQAAQHAHERREVPEHSQRAQPSATEIEERWRRLEELYAEAKARGDRFERTEEEEAEIEAVRRRWNLLKDRWAAKHGTPPTP